MIEKLITYDHTISEDGKINVRKITRIVEDGVELSKTFHRHVVSVGDDIANEDRRTKQIINAIIADPDIQAEYAAMMADNVITVEEKLSLWDKIKSVFSRE